MGPKHTAGFAIFAAAGMIVITLLVVVFALPSIDWRHLDLGTLNQNPLDMWRAFVFVVLALSGVEAIANLTGVMHKPVYNTARKSIWLVAAEVAAFNLILCLAMVALAPPRQAHVGDMMAFIAHKGLGPWGEWPVRIIGGLLLLSATNTAVNGLMSIVYVMSRDGEMPAIFQKLNSFGAPWVGAIVAAGRPMLVLLFAHDLETLASLYAIGVVGAVAINCTLCVPPTRGCASCRGRSRWRSWGCCWSRSGSRWRRRSCTPRCLRERGAGDRAVAAGGDEALRHPPAQAESAAAGDRGAAPAGRLRQAQADAGDGRLRRDGRPALRAAKADNAALVVCFVREVALSYKVEAEMQLTLDTDPAAQALFTNFLEHGHRFGVPIIPAYDSGPNGPELIAELAALFGVEAVLIGTSRRGASTSSSRGAFRPNWKASSRRKSPYRCSTPTNPRPPWRRERGEGGNRQGDKEKRRQGAEDGLHRLISRSPCLPVSLSPCLLVSLSPCLPVSLSPCLLVSPPPPPSRLTGTAAALAGLIAQPRYTVAFPAPQTRDHFARNSA